MVAKKSQEYEREGKALEALKKIEAPESPEYRNVLLSYESLIRDAHLYGDEKFTKSLYQNLWDFLTDAVELSPDEFESFVEGARHTRATITN